MVILEMRNDFITCTWMVGVVDMQDMKNHHIGHFYFSICLGKKDSQFG